MAKRARQSRGSRTVAAAKAFYALTPERILDAVEAGGLRTTGRALALNSFENRVVEVEIDVDDPRALRSVSDRFRVAKFYRPGRWSPAQIHEEHAFLAALSAADVPVIAPLPFPDGDTLRTMDEAPIHYALFPKRGGRVPDEIDAETAARIGRMLARVHIVAAGLDVQERLSIDPATTGYGNLDALLDRNAIPERFADPYARLVEEICETSRPWFDDVAVQPLHGDAHRNNLLWGSEGLFLLDFDDMAIGPCVQDIWLMIPGREAEDLRLREALIAGYRELKDFDPYEWVLVEPLRALRYVQFHAWIARRWEDPAFPAAFPYFGDDRFWSEAVADLAEQRDRIRQGVEIPDY